MSDKQLQLGQDGAFLSVQDAWERALEILSQQVNKPTFESLIKTARPVSIDGDLIRIAAASSFQKQWLENKHLPAIREVMETHLGRELTLKVEISDKAPEPVIFAEKLPKKPAPHDDEELSQPLNSKYTFDTFVVGPTNRLAHACAEAVAESPGCAYNPLFIYGGAGLGKTHLMHAIGQFAMQSRAGARVAFISGETFTYHYITALREHRTADFRRRYRNIDLWLVDDIQFLVGKERTEEEFFHTYNALYEMGKQVVLSSDRAPKDLQLDSRLLSRFECGMLADISPPDLETRIAILQSKAEDERMSLSDEVILYIAQLITSNIRQLEGALIKLHAYASLMKTSVTPTLAEDVLGRYFGANAPRPVDIEQVQQAVAGQYRVDVSDLKGKCRSQDIVLPRQVAMYLIRQLTECSLPSIGKAFGRDHSTVLHACKKIEEKLTADRAFAALMEELCRRISNRKVD